MKKTIHLIFALIIFSLSVSAQITLTQSDLPVAGTAYIVGADSAYNAAITPGGANQSWDYSGLVNSVQDTIGFIAASTSPYASNFPLANLASHNVVDSMWTFFISNPTGFYINGAYSYGSSGVGGLSIFHWFITPHNYSNRFLLPIQILEMMFPDLESTLIL